MADELLKGHFRDLARLSGNSYCFSGFLNLAEQDVLSTMKNELGCVTLFGGTQGCERVMARFGDPEELGYQQPFPIQCLKASPATEKFAEDLTHRDFLGALMNLGIQRDTIGDILVQNHTAYLFVTEKMTLYIMEHLDRVRRTVFHCSPTVEIPPALFSLAEEAVTVSSLRIDSVIAQAYCLSRSDSLELFPAKLVFLNSRQCENNSQLLKDGDLVSVRGKGRFLIHFDGRVTRKGKLAVTIAKYV